MFEILAALGIVAAIAAAGYTRNYFLPKERFRRLLTSTKAYQVSEFPENEHGRVIGKVLATGQVLRSPLTGRACIYYVAAVSQQEGGGARGLQWSMLAKEIGESAFAISDSTGRALVDPTVAQVVLEPDHCAEASSRTLTDLAQIAFLERKGINPHGWMFAAQLQFVEAIIPVDGVLAVCGWAVREPDPDAEPASEYRGAAATRLRFAGSSRCPMQITDDPATMKPTTT